MACGYRAIDSLRLEKGYRVWAADITPDETPYEARARVLRARGQGVHRLGRALRAVRASSEVGTRLRCIVLEDPRSVALGNEPVRVDGEVVGRVTSGGYGYTVERSIAYAYLPRVVEIGAAVEIDIFGQWVAGEVSRGAAVRPERTRMRSLKQPA